MSTRKRQGGWDSVADALRQKIAESELSFIEMERRTGGVVKRQSIMLFVRGEQDSLRLDKADLLMRLFGLSVVETKPQAARKPKKKAKGR